MGSISSLSGRLSVFQGLRCRPTYLHYAAHKTQRTAVMHSFCSLQVDYPSCRWTNGNANSQGIQRTRFLLSSFSETATAREHWICLHVLLLAVLYRIRELCPPQTVLERCLHSWWTNNGMGLRISLRLCGIWGLHGCVYECQLLWDVMPCPLIVTNLAKIRAVLIFRTKHSKKFTLGSSEMSVTSQSTRCKISQFLSSYV